VAAELEKELGAEVTLIKGSGGVFDVEADGRLVYSKARTGRFPDPGEVPAVVKAKAPK
jgi:selT/selW/selH-like putative selenoprotein